ncbi:OpgC family protein [Methylobrevis pamukkalensis]|uniref:OpgC protein n=1 Tax=Methylobrevis pamukkalensis TaxID=1439726 RepID=A0A1E3GZ04_9HYPH|nr:OpgC domain-containing protein [Methylobrevis pamukkalensis]ODN69309.1 OpgC protein [Methylobrevis pamukkalensis]
MNRLGAVDGMRGYFLVFMVLNHLAFQGGYLLVKVNHGELGYVQDAQGFVFLSGLLVGMVYARQMVKRGYDHAAAKMRWRAGELYLWSLVCIGTIFLLGFLLPASSDYWSPWLWQLADHDPAFLAASATLLYQPTYMDILPQYMVYLLVAPPLVWLCVTGRWMHVAAGSALMWLAVQFGLHLPLRDAVHAGMQSLHPDLELRAHFNVFAWQAVFISGLVLGALTSTKQIDWGRVMSRATAPFAGLALAIVVFFMAWRLAVTFEVMPEAVMARFAAQDVRGEFSLQYLLNFSALAFVVAWTMIAGPQSESRIVQGAARLLHGVFGLPVLQLIGRHSLHVYVFHVIMIYLIVAFDHAVGPFGEMTKTLIAVLAVAALVIPALWRERGRPALAGLFARGVPAG